MFYYAMSPNLNLANVAETDGEAIGTALAAIASCFANLFGN